MTPTPDSLGELRLYLQNMTIINTTLSGDSVYDVVLSAVSLPTGHNLWTFGVQAVTSFGVPLLTMYNSFTDSLLLVWQSVTNGLPTPDATWHAVSGATGNSQFAVFQNVSLSGSIAAVYATPDGDWIIQYITDDSKATALLRVDQNTGAIKWGSSHYPYTGVDSCSVSVSWHFIALVITTPASVTSLYSIDTHTGIGAVTPIALLNTSPPRIAFFPTTEDNSTTTLLAISVNNFGIYTYDLATGFRMQQVLFSNATGESNITVGSMVSVRSHLFYTVGTGLSFLDIFFLVLTPCRNPIHSALHDALGHLCAYLSQ